MGLCKQELVNLQNELWVDKTHEYPKYPWDNELRIYMGNAEVDEVK